MLIFPSLLSPPFVIHFGLIPLSSETILILYYFHFTGFMTSPYPHIISRGNFTPSRPTCFLPFLPVSLLLSHSHPPFILSLSVLFSCLSLFFLSFHAFLYALCLSRHSEGSTQPLGSRLQRQTPNRSRLAHTHTHSRLPVHIIMCVNVLSARVCLFIWNKMMLSVHCH